MGKEWKFTQLGGPKRTLTLAGGAAPHGRPRKNPVVSDGVRLRRSRVYYPDAKNLPPTTHIFGIQWKDWELKGRFDDRFLGKDGTKKAIRDWQSFVADAQGVLVSWGDIIAARAIIDEFEPGREAENQCSYTIVILIDDELGAVNAVPTNARSKSPSALCQALQEEFRKGVAKIPTLPHAGDLQPDFLDSLDEAVSSLNTFSATLVNIAGEIDALEEGTLDQLERLRAGAMQTKTAVNKMRGTFETTENDAALLFRAADADVQWAATRANADVSTTRMLSLLDEIDREVEIARRSRVLAIYMAKAGDTWESIATVFFGGPEEAGAIRDANGIQYGELPFPGRTYQVPRAA